MPNECVERRASAIERVREHVSVRAGEHRRHGPNVRYGIVPRRMSRYELLVFAHVLAAAAWFGAASLSAVLIELASRASETEWLVRFGEFDEREATLVAECRPAGFPARSERRKICT